MNTGFFIGKLTAIGSMRLIYMASISSVVRMTYAAQNSAIIFRLIGWANAHVAAVMVGKIAHAGLPT